MSAFETGLRKNIPAVLIYVFCHFSDGIERVLMIHRDSADRPGDFHAGKWNGLGGKCEADESYLEAAVRELEEESTLRLAPEVFKFAGFLQFPNFKPRKSEDWSCMLYRARVDESAALSVPEKNAEGSLHWVKTTEILVLNLWAGDRTFIPYILAGKAFTGATWYEHGEVKRHDLTPVG
ncbi:MAG: NUDIX domain-containing protein [Cryobacterium sp.]|nr:NUDIX domain-containing protein [Oligoflexia bacterium]